MDGTVKKKYLKKVILKMDTKRKENTKIFAILF